MSEPRYLIDTNVFIKLEDDGEVAPAFASLIRLANRHSVSVFVHEAAIDDIQRDKNAGRRRISLSKIEKFPHIGKTADVSRKYLQTKFGRIQKSNDLVDATLLHALDIGVVDFLVTEDRGLHDRAEKVSPNFGDRVLYVADAVSLLQTTYESVNIILPAVIEKEANTLPQNDPIFQSLRLDYKGFDIWWREKCIKSLRKCWIVEEEGYIAGLVIRKKEKPEETEASLPGQKILKICTFKVRSESRGIKLGELLLKQILWHAQTNKYDIIYLTTFPAQEMLISLIEYYGFRHTYDKDNGELVYEKVISQFPPPLGTDQSPFDIARINYPRFAIGERISSYVVPIKEEFHEILFPELIQPKSQMSLFSDNATRPGNTIRKVYLCKAQANITQPGALLFFYKGKSNSSLSQAITTIGVFEEMTLASSTEELRRLAGGRSVYRDDQLIQMNATRNNPVKVINFLLVHHLTPPLSLPVLKEEHIFAKTPPQSIKKLTSGQQMSILKLGSIGFTI